MWGRSEQTTLLIEVAVNCSKPVPGLKESTCLEGQRPRGLKLREAARNLTWLPLPTRQSVLKKPARPVFQVSSEAPLPHLEDMPTMASSFNDLGGIKSHRTGGSLRRWSHFLRPEGGCGPLPQRACLPGGHPGTHATAPLLGPTAAQRAASSLKTPQLGRGLTALSLLEPLGTSGPPQARSGRAQTARFSNKLPTA